ncbi:DUF2726 domain-containing protein [Salinicola halimionae]|uniref:DUF2726 domain-containing protein n=1 Tax=Salinicola halimionae TaxID=1949081 RepID=UPI00130027FF|nr:DUF2726 domain-containing protein [Salinicola halimionae]
MQGINIWQMVLENSVALKIIGPLALLMIVVSVFKRISLPQRKKVTAQGLIGKGDAYIKKARLITETEQVLFTVLLSKYSDTHHVFCQVRVADVIQPNTTLYKERSREWMALFRQMSQWHFDFVICDKGSMEVVRVIELDDASHKRKDRARRDGIMNRICDDANVALERVDLSALQAMTNKV